jgi:UDPglucose 6-dehydrogenase
MGRLESGDLPVVEPGLAELAKMHRERIRYASDAKALGGCAAVYIACDVPTDERGDSDLAPVRRLIDTVRVGLARDATLVVLCQVPPGFTRTLEWPAAQRFYQVETLVFGRAVERAMHPERFIVGCADPAAPLPARYRRFLEAFDCPVLPMRYESAELAKIAVNCCLVASVTVANTLAELCEKIGADWSEIVPALKLDKRIGPHAYLSPGLGIAGGNLERDLATVCRIADERGTDATVVRAWLENSRRSRDWVLRTLHREVLSKVQDPLVAVLGLAYKQDTHSTKNSASLALLEALRPFRVRVFDPVVPASTASHPNCLGATSALEACDGADALAVMTPWSQFANLDPREIAGRLRGGIVLDPYAVLDATRCRAAGLRYHTLGVEG